MTQSSFLFELRNRTVILDSTERLLHPDAATPEKLFPNASLIPIPRNNLEHIQEQYSMADPKRSSEFIVRVEGVKLPSDVEARISGEIQAIVLREVAKIDFKGDLLSKIPRKEWLGFWLRDRIFDVNTPALEITEKQIKSPGK